jgi:hypothetical protein
MRLLVCGNRDWSCPKTIETWLLPFVRKHGANVVLIHGAAQGADSIAEAIGQRLGWTIDPYPADWNANGKAAGSIRNVKMYDEGRPDRCLAFGQILRGAKLTGTGDMVNICLIHGTLVTIVPQAGVMP